MTHDEGGRSMKKHSGMGTGSASILVIFVLLCLTTFATLSLISARADRSLSRRAAQSLSSYYDADCRAVDLMAHLADALGSVDAAAGRERYFTQCAQRALEQFNTLQADEAGGGLVLRYQIDIDDRRALSVGLRVLFPARPGDPRVEVISWRTIQTGEWIADETIPLWQGD